MLGVVFGLLRTWFTRTKAEHVVVYDVSFLILTDDFAFLTMKHASNPSISLLGCDARGICGDSASPADSASRTRRKRRRGTCGTSITRGMRITRGASDSSCCVCKLPRKNLDEFMRIEGRMRRTQF
jgi:hypothetical protein